MKAALYARVSTNDCRCSICSHKWTPKGNGETLCCPKCGSASVKRQDASMQTRELRDFARARGWPVIAEYVDEGVSGAKDSRPELDRLLADAHRRRFDVVCVWKFDRFARSVSHLLRALETFNALGVGFVSLSESLDTSTPAGKMVFTVLGAVAELERSLIAERVRAGLRNARAKGKRLGRPRVTVDAARIAALRAKRKSIQPLHMMSLEEGVKACLSLAQKAREAAAGVDFAWEQLEQSGALGEVIRYARSQGIDLPRADVTEAARTLRAYAGAIFLYAGSLQRPDLLTADAASSENGKAVVAN